MKYLFKDVNHALNNYFFVVPVLCPKCGRLLKKIDFRDQIFEDTYIEKEISISKKIYERVSCIVLNFLFILFCINLIYINLTYLYSLK